MTHQRPVVRRTRVGASLPFHGAVREYLDGLDEPPAGGCARGDHDVGCWRRIAPDQLALLGDTFRG